MKKQKHFLDSVEWGIIPIVVYRGVLVTKLIGGYKVLNKTVVSAEWVDGVIDGALDGLKNSIKDDETGIVSTFGEMRQP